MKRKYGRLFTLYLLHFIIIYYQLTLQFGKDKELNDSPDGEYL